MYTYLRPLTVEDYKAIADRPDDLSSDTDNATTHWGVFKSPDGKNLAGGFSYTRTDKWAYFRTQSGAICKTKISDFVLLFPLVANELLSWVHSDLVFNATTELEDASPYEVPDDRPHYPVEAGSDAGNSLI